MSGLGSRVVMEQEGCGKFTVSCKGAGCWSRLALGIIPVLGSDLSCKEKINKKKHVSWTFLVHKR